MAFEFVNAARHSALALAVGALVSACGGGGGNSEDAPVSTTGSAAAVDSSNNSSGTSTASTTSGTSSAGTTASVSQSGAAAGSDAAPSSTTATGTDSTANTTVASADDTASVASVAQSSIGLVGTTASTTSASTSGSTATSVGSGGSTSASHGTRSALGLNLSSLDYYAPIVPTIDLMKKANAWLTQCNPYGTGGASCKNFATGASTWDTLEESHLDLDADGWPRSLPAADDATVKYRSVGTVILSGGWQQAGQYVVRYDGAGTLTYSGVATKNAAKSTAGRDVIDVVNTNTSGLIMAITATTPGNYLRNVRVYPPGGACANDLTTYAASAASCTSATGAFVAFENFPAGQIWHPALLTELKGFRAARFMDWQRTNTSAVTDWSQRTIPTARSWNTPAGVPIEQIVSLANTANVDAWINVPTHATDDYVKQMATAIHQKLASNLSIDVEYSNEPWNYAFPATHWMYDQAQAAWPAEVAAKTDPYLLQSNWYANRLVQVCGIIKTQFGADKNRVRCVANTQAASTGSANGVLNCTVAAKTLGQACGKSIDVLAIAPYFGSYVGTTKLRTTVSTWYTAADGGLGQLFNEIMGSEGTTSVVAPLVAGGSAVPGGSLAQIHSWMTANKAIADKFGIPLWAYEGGQGLVPPGGDTDTSLVTLFTNANRDARMGAAYTRMLADWQASGGQTFMLYDDVATPSKYGMWGLKENMFDTTAAKWSAVAKARDTVSCWWSGC